MIDWKVEKGKRAAGIMKCLVQKDIYDMFSNCLEAAYITSHVNT